MNLWADEPPQDRMECHDPEGSWLEHQAAEKADRDRDHLNAETDRLEDEPPTTGDQ